MKPVQEQCVGVFAKTYPVVLGAASAGSPHFLYSWEQGPHRPDGNSLLDASPVRIHSTATVRSAVFFG